MKKNILTEVPKGNGSMLTQKTNEDFNKKQPELNDFKEKTNIENRTFSSSSTKLKIKKTKMKTEKQLNEDILKITLLIQEKYPELSKYIAEFTVTNPDKEQPEINAKHLANYYDSLINVLKRYAPTHNSSDY